LIASQIYKWGNDAKRGALMGIKNEGELHSKIELDELKKENEELKGSWSICFSYNYSKKKLEQDLQRNKKLNP